MNRESMAVKTKNGAWDTSLRLPDPWAGELPERDDTVEKELKTIRKELKKLNKKAKQAPLPLWGFRTKEGESLFWWLVGCQYFVYLIPKFFSGISIIEAGQVGFSYIVIAYILTRFCSAIKNWWASS